MHFLRAALHRYGESTLLFFSFFDETVTKAGPSIPILTFENAELTIVKLMIHPNDAVACIKKKKKKKKKHFRSDYQPKINRETIIVGCGF